MPKRVIEVEWDDLPAEIGMVPPGGLLVLVRKTGRPNALVRLKPKEGKVSREALREAILRKVGRDALQAPTPPPPMPAQPVSIVVCTRDRPDLLHACLDALRPHAQAGHEVIVVDNASITPAAEQMVKEFNYRYLREPDPGLNRARNLGVRAARHPIVAFTDDDCAPSPHWLDALGAPFIETRVGGTTGLVLPLELETRAQEKFEDYCTNRRLFQPRRYTPDNTPPSRAGLAGMGANMALRREWIYRLGGFDVRFDGGTPTLSGGDTEMFSRLLQAGAHLVYVPEAVVWHRHPLQEHQLRQVIFGYGTGVFAFLSKRFWEDRDLSVLSTAPRWLLGPPVKAVLNRLLGRPATSLDVVLWELWGALNGPVRYLRVKGLESSLPWKGDERVYGDTDH